MQTSEVSETGEINESKLKWGILDVLLVIVFIFLFTRFLAWFTADFIKGLVVTQKYLIAILFQSTAVFLAVIYFKILKGVTWSELGIRFEGLPRALAYGAFGGVILFFLIILSGLVMQRIFPTEPSLQPFAEVVIGAVSFNDLILLLIVGAILVPIVEEIYFRGMVYPVFKRRWGIAAGMIISGAFFSLLHFDMLRFLPLLLGGIGLAYIYERSGSLFACILAHGLWNGVMILILYYSADYFAGL